MLFDTLITNATLVTVNATNQVIRNGFLAVKDGKIAALGSASQLQELLTTSSSSAGTSSAGTLATMATHVVQANNAIVMPGIINCHTHLPMTLLRSYADDMFLQPWLNDKVWPVEDCLDQECVRIGSVLGIAEMLASGITSFTDMYEWTDVIAQVVADTGIKANLSHPIFDFDQEGFDFTEHVAKKNLDKLVAEFHQYDNSRIKIDASIHSVYTSHYDAWVAMGQYARKHDLGLHIHLSETVRENADCQTRYGKSPTAILDQAGCLFPKTHLAHGVWLSDADVALLVQRGCSLSHQIISNLKLACGIARVPSYLAQGLTVALGTDSVCSNNNIDMFEEMKMAALIQKNQLQDPTVLPASQLVRMATIEGAKAQHRAQTTGSLEVGKDADLIMLETQAVNMAPSFDPFSTIVYSARANNVTLTMVRGKVLYQNGKFTTLDYEQALKDLHSYAIPKLYSAA